MIQMWIIFERKIIVVIGHLAFDPSKSTKSRNVSLVILNIFFNQSLQGGINGSPSTHIGSIMDAGKPWPIVYPVASLATLGIAENPEYRQQRPSANVPTLHFHALGLF